MSDTTTDPRVARALAILEDAERVRIAQRDDGRGHISSPVP